MTRRRRLLATDDAVRGTPLAGVADVLVQASTDGSPAAVQRAYDALRTVAYAGTLQSGVRSAGWPWAVVLTGAAAAAPGDALPEPDDWCRQRLGGACLDGSGLSAAGAKGLITAGVILVLLAGTLALVAADLRRGGGPDGRGGGGRMSAMLTGTVPPSPAVPTGMTAGAIASVSTAGGQGKRGEAAGAV
jgi:hypothetical protein